MTGAIKDSSLSFVARSRSAQAIGDLRTGLPCRTRSAFHAKLHFGR